ncbi:MAG: LacI family DNA-binding transcriptional regulator [Rhizobiales bacterium]|nr:LacI family DNA-binding transcriptional regulator [Hyphomicrobiales bacterium]
MSEPVSIHMVAARAGCSIATVSRVINGTAQTSAEVRERVEEAVSALAYRPSEIGRSLKTRKTRTIGIVVPSFTNPVFASSIAGVEEVARAHSRTVLLTATEYHGEREEEIVETLLAKQVEGLVLTVADADNSRALDRLDAAKVPYVLLYNQPARADRYAVSVDNIAGARELVGQLIALGHKRIAFVAGRFRTSDRSLLRYQGCVEAMDEAGLPKPEVLEVDYAGDQPEEPDVLATKLRGLNAPTALFCSNDLLALAVIAASRSIGMKVPGDVSVAGFDGISIGTMIEPSLASIAQPTRAMGTEAMEILHALCQAAPVEPGVRLLQHQFRPGGSIAAAPVESKGGT